MPRNYPRSYFFYFQILNTLRLVDSYIGQLMNKLYEENMHNCVNIIIVADHGTLFFSHTDALNAV